MTADDAPPLYVYMIDGYKGPVETVEVRDGLLFDVTPDNRLIGVEILDYERLTIDGKTKARRRPGNAPCSLDERCYRNDGHDGDHSHAAAALTPGAPDHE